MKGNLTPKMYFRYRIIFFCENWKLCIHLLLRTSRFGVNNEWWSFFPSAYFGDSLWKIMMNIITIRPILRNYRAGKYRAVTLGFLPPDMVRKLGWK